MSSVDFDSETNEMNVKEEINSDEDKLGKEFIPDIHPTQTSVYHLVPDVEIKSEEMDFHQNHNSTADPHSENQFNLVSSIPHFDFVSVKAEQENDLNEFYVDLLLQCQRDCETCKTYMRLLSEHVKSTHCLSQPTQDPLQIDPLNLDPDLSIHIKCEVDECIDKMDCSDEDSMLNPESGQDIESESERESDSNYKVSPHLTPNVHRPDLAKNKASSDSKESKDKRSTLSSSKQLKCKSEIEHENDSSYNVSFQVTRNVCRRGLNKNNASSDSKPPKSDQPSRKEFKCNECDKTFSSRKILGKHRRIHTGLKPYKCDTCEKSFLQRFNLTRHKRIHTGEKPFKCDTCGKSFAGSNHLKRHKRIHTGVKPFKCDTCEKYFSEKNYLTEHKKIHGAEKPHKCDACEKSFTRSNTLKVHYQRIHTGDRPQKCDQCEKSFTRIDRLINHRKLHSVGRNVQV